MLVIGRRATLDLENRADGTVLCLAPASGSSATTVLQQWRSNALRASGALEVVAVVVEEKIPADDKEVD